MEEKIISGIQQIGIGVRDVHEAWKWYKKYFGLDIKMFEEEAVAELMLPYTGGKPRSRHAVLALNLQGGGGFEIWQYKDREPRPAQFNIQIGDLGIYAAKIKTRDVKATYDHYKAEGLNLMSPIMKNPAGDEHFFVKDPAGNLFQIIHGKSWFYLNGWYTGATAGAILGVSDMNSSIKFYKEILGYDTVIYDLTDTHQEYSSLPGGNSKMRRVLLQHSQPRVGAFSNFLGPTEIELVQVIDRKPRKIFEQRYWGDLGFIHLCFDIGGMHLLREECKQKGYPFTVDTGESFDMGEAAGAFSYIEDPDGTLIEFVETHKIPLVKKLGIYLNLRKRDQQKALPKWLLKGISFNRVKQIG